jgi:[lysine-biosynthesis-protein LysW]--L-2-aminoadipate ligase
VRGVHDSRADRAAHVRGPDAGFFLVAERSTATNTSLITAIRKLGLDAQRLAPDAAPTRLRPGDVALARLDVLPTLDGVESGLWGLRRVERQGVLVLNPVASLLASHDKLATAVALARAGLPHPRTSVVGDEPNRAELSFPLVVKPRFGSWGRDVSLCRNLGDLDVCLAALRRRPWFRRQGAIVQELVPLVGHDLRVVVAGGTVVGAIERVAASGEWRTNIALGAARRRIEPAPEGCALAIAAAAAIGADLVGVDLLPRPEGGWVVLELNGAVDFTTEYSLPGRDAFAETATSLCATALEAATPRRAVVAIPSEA